MTPTRFTLSLGAALCACLMVSAGCQKAAAPPASTEPQRLEDRATELVVASIPDGLAAIAQQEGEVFAFAPRVAERGGRLSVAVAPPQPRGVNLIEQVKAAQAEAERRAEGIFHGSRELVAPWGPAFSARSSWAEAGARIEELRLLTLHPGGGDRLMTVTYRYPAADPAASSARFGEAIRLLGELEAMAAPLSP